MVTRSSFQFSGLVLLSWSWGASSSVLALERASSNHNWRQCIAKNFDFIYLLSISNSCANYVKSRIFCSDEAYIIQILKDIKKSHISFSWYILQKALLGNSLCPQGNYKLIFLLHFLLLQKTFMIHIVALVNFCHFALFSIQNLDFMCENSNSLLSYILKVSF